MSVVPGLVIWAALIALLTAVIPAPVEAKPEERYGGVYRRPLGNDPSTLDPARINDIHGRTIAQQIYDGLVEFDESLAIKPAIASSWKSSRDGLIWTFYLRKGVKFHHGREVTAEDFVYSFARIIDPKTKSGAAGLFSKIKGAKEFVEGKAKQVEGLKALDRYTLQIVLTESSAPFVATLAIGHAKVVPKEVAEDLKEEFGLRPIGTGPFKFEKRELEDSPIPAGERSRLLKDKHYQVVRRPILGIRFLGLNTALPPLDNPKVRQALNYAIDKRRIAKEIYNDRYPPGTGILPPGTYGYDPKLKAYPYNPEKARKLLAEAGYPRGKGLPPFHLWSAAKYDDAVQELEAIARYLAAIGVKLEIHYNTNWPDFKSKVYDGRFQMFRYSWYADTPDPASFLHLLFHSRGPHNLARLKNPVVDNLLQKAEAELDYLKRVQLYREVEKKILEQAPIIVLGYYSYERLFQSYVKGIRVSALGDRYIPMRSIWLDPKPLVKEAKQ